MGWMRMYCPVAALGTAVITGCGGDGSGPCPGDASPDVLETSLPPEAGRDAATTGGIFVDASVVLVTREGYVCPGISSFSIDPAELSAGQTAQLGVTTIGPMPSSVQWTASPVLGGTFSSATSVSPTFVCAGPGTVMITVQVELVVPDAGDVCEGVSYTTYSNAIQCE
jgi:hypothetical protein